MEDVIIYFLSGMASAFTYKVFPIFVICPLLFERFGRSLSNFMFNLLLFSFLVLSFILVVFATLTENLSTSYAFQVYEKYVIFELLFYLWSILILIKIRKRVLSIKGFTAFRYLGILALAFIVTRRVLSGAGETVGPLLIESMADGMVNHIWLLVIYTLGLLTPFLVFLIIVSSYYRRLRKIKWWRGAQIVAVGILLLDAAFATIRVYLAS